jgi:hypothetical protein
MTQPFSPEVESTLLPETPGRLDDSPVPHATIVAPGVVEHLGRPDVTAAAPSDGTGVSGNLAKAGKNAAATPAKA